MSQERWIAQLGRLYKETPSDKGEGSKEYTKQFNRVLSKLQDEFPEDEFVQNTENIELDSVWSEDKRKANRKIRLRCGQLADALGYDLSESELEESRDLTVISIQSEQNQTAEQEVNQEVSIENVMEMVNYTTLGEAKKEELRSIVQDFEDELEKDDPDPSILREFIEKAKGYSVDVSAKLSMLALRHGLVAILGL
ncbi:hypothetical protein M0R88_05925 [Halorussus gelatinilyticus]|uniref:Uncharacterized protein n=1 Tax=Halorussus gelatinilyticus TaxID=2937524 RepID=A0A8U0IKG7_9EURY|nr:hypothetical protein [Halorussus gelatinilyticus]UPW01637.1 hypothetical protein M0R88_05925 [Halorussus gelatinilyticus]